MGYRRVHVNKTTLGPDLILLMLQGCLPDIITTFDTDDHYNNGLYGQIIRQSLVKILPEYLFSLRDGGGRDSQEQGDYFHALLPYVTWTECTNVPCNMSFFVISRYRSNAFRFFFEIVTHWLVPGKRLNAISLFAADFKIPLISNEIYTLCEVVIRVEDAEDLLFIQSNLAAMEAEVRLGMESSYYARRILEIKGVSTDEKIALVQEHIASLIRRLPQYFDHDLMAEMQHLFVICREEFKVARLCRHLTRIISILYLFRKEMKEKIKTSKTRFVTVKIFRAHIKSPAGNRPVLGIVVGVNFLRDKEFFEKRHLLSTIRSHIQNAVPVEGSYIMSRKGYEPFCHLYLEIEKNDGQKFTAKEISGLVRDLPLELKDQIEHPVHPVFMPRNEEEIMRNVLVLSSQIKYVRDIPQVVINFDEQTHSHLIFNVIFVQVVKPGSQSLQEILTNAETPLEYIHERTKTVGFLRNKYMKEAVIFRVKLSKEPFVRRDHSIDLYKARQVVVMELSRLVGDIRDFNGGMIAKQNEILTSVRDLMAEEVKYNEHVLENFFFSIMPPVIRTLIEPFAVKTLFLMTQELVDKGSLNNDIQAHNIRVAPDFVFVVIRGGSNQLKEEIAKKTSHLLYHPSEIASSTVRIHEIPYLGYIYRCDDDQKHTLFCQAIENTLATWDYKKHTKTAYLSK